jgi:Uma2 family endonuclease
MSAMNIEPTPKREEWVTVTREETILVPVPPRNLPEEDDQNLESDWHRLAINLLIESLRYYWRARHDFFVGGNMFLYFSEEQVRKKDYRGPDFFFVGDVDGDRPRRFWAIWDEEGRGPDVILELLSPTTAEQDRTTKKDIYASKLRVPEYFLYDPETKGLEGWRLGPKQRYQPIPVNDRGWLWSDQLELWLGSWHGPYLERTDTYPRFFDADGKLVLIGREAEEQQAEAARLRAEVERQRAEAEKQRAEAEKQRADAAEEEVKRLRALLEQSNPASGQ